MPTIAESLYADKKERHEQAVRDYVSAKPGDVSDSDEVFRARLFGLGYRGAEISTELHLAQMAKIEHRLKDKVTTTRAWLKRREDALKNWSANELWGYIQASWPTLKEDEHEYIFQKAIATPRS